MSVFALNLTVKMFQDRELLPDGELAQKSFSHVDSENLACTRIAAETDRGGGGGVTLGLTPPSGDLDCVRFWCPNLMFSIVSEPGSHSRPIL